ncbi:MAG: mRNA surveillance protein pelota [Candidatus Aenigmatarchaeota archaeon]
MADVMHVIKKDMKEGSMVIKVESADDLWHLERMIGPGDTVKSRTMRKVSVKAGGEFAMSEKRPMVLAIEAEKLSFDETTGTLRITGKITEGPSDTKLSSYHTIAVEPGTVITVTKERGGASDMKRIKESAVRQPRILLCVMDREDADFALVSGRGISVIGKVECHDREDMDSYHAEVLKFLSNQQGYDALVVAGPGFEAGNMAKFARENDPKLAARIKVESASHTGINGINEVMRRSGERVLKESRIGAESRLVEEVLSRMKSDGLVTYGKAHVAGAISMGAVETLLVSREKMSEFEGLMEECEKMKGEVKVITADHSLGEQFLHLGGIAATLRFKTAY